MRSEREIPSVSGDLWRSLIELQSEFVSGGDAGPLLDQFLTLLLEHTGSAYGFLGEVRFEPGARAHFRPLFSTPFSWLVNLPEFTTHEETQGQDPLSLRSFLEAALETGQPVPSRPLVDRISASPVPDVPFLDSLLILPLRNEGEVVGLAGLAQRPGGYESWLISQIQHALSVGGKLLAGWRTQQRYQAQEATLRLQQGELEHLRQVLASVNEGLWDWYIPTEMLRVSRRWRELLGYAEGELEPSLSGWRELCHPEDLPEFKQLSRAHLDGHTPYLEFTYRARSKSGQWFWFLSRGRVVAHDSQGRPLRIVGTDVDITARKQGEERLRALFRAIPDLMFRIRADGTFIDWNDGSPEPTAVPPEAFLGKRIQSLPLPGFFVDLTMSNIQRVIREGGLAVYEYELEKKGRGLQHYEARAVRSGPDEAVCIVRNITDRKLMEERQAQLVQAEKLASLGQIAAGIAHEIKNPVSYVTSNLNTLGQHVARLLPLLRRQRELLEAQEGEGRAPTAQELAELRAQWERADAEELLAELPEIIHESLTGTRRITEIIQSLRSFSREEAGSPQSVNLNEELESTLRMVWGELKYKCEVIRELSPLPPIPCYPTQIAQVFTNLLVNAAQAIEQRGEIRIHTRVQGTEVVVSISDTGKGMTPETLSRIFTPFFTTKPRGQGTGLGLSISRDIIHRHGGRMEVQSEPGQGTTFTLYLPVEGPPSASA